MALVAGALIVVACSGGSVATPATSAVTDTTTSSTAAATSSTTSTSTTSTSTTVPETTSTSTTVPETTSTSTTSTSTTVPETTSTTSVPVVPVGALSPAFDPFTYPTDVEVVIGQSVEFRDITLLRRGTPGGTKVLVVGVIHGNEAAGVAVVDRLAAEPVPDGVELWLVRSMNPDGQAIGDRQNANGVDLNRNFPEKWDVLGALGEWQYGGAGPASEPETQTIVALGDAVRPDIVLWYHQDLFRIAPGTGRSGEIRTRYAAVAGLPIVDITGGTYTGTASQWSRTVIPETGVGITVELGDTVNEAEIVAHVAAVHAVATEFF